MSLTLAENVIVVGADNRHPMLEKTNCSSWASRMMLYIKGKEHGKLLVYLVLNGPFQYETMEIPTPAAFQTDDLDAFDYDLDDVPLAKAVLMANISSYESDVHSKNEKVVDFEKQRHSLKLQLKATVESHKTLSTTVECLKKESKQKEDKYLDEVIDLQKKNKALDNVVYKMEQAYWLPISKLVSEKPPIPSELVLEKEIPRELPLISLNRISGVERIKGDFEKDVKPFAQTLKEYFRMFEHGLNKELKEIRVVFTQIETEVAKCSVDKKYFKIDKKELSLDYDQLLQHIICQEVMNITMHANDHSDNVLPVNNNSLKYDNSALELLKHENNRFMDEYNETLVLKAELAKKNDMIAKAEFFIINELQAQLKATNVLIEKLKEHMADIKGKNVVESVQNVPNSNVITSKVYKLDFPPISPCIKNNMAARVEYLKHTQENADILRKIIKHARDLWPLDSNLASACKFVTRIHELLVYVSATCPSLKHLIDKLVVVTPMNRTRKVRFAESNDTSKDNTQKQNPCKNEDPKFLLLHLLPVSILGRTNRTLVPGIGLLQAYDQASLSAHQLR
nr:hypothetical protein [Tanacetum cinerariifolium]